MSGQSYDGHMPTKISQVKSSQVGFVISAIYIKYSEMKCFPMDPSGATFHKDIWDMLHKVHLDYV